MAGGEQLDSACTPNSPGSLRFPLDTARVFLARNEKGAITATFFGPA